MKPFAVVVQEPGDLQLRPLELDAPGEHDLLVDVQWSGVSTGTERLLWTGTMPPFPGMGYPLVPGYESVGVVREAGAATSIRPGTHVFVPGAQCFGPVRGLFGGAAETLTVPEARVVPVPDGLGESACLLALAATAWHALLQVEEPGLVVGHGALGRLVARLAPLRFGVPVTVWEKRPERRAGDFDYAVIDPKEDTERAYASVIDVSGHARIVDDVAPRMKKGGTIVLAGFYSERVSFDFAPAFIKEARLRVAAEWSPADLQAVAAHVQAGALPLDGIISHRAPARDAERAYPTAFDDPDCVKLVLDWRSA